MKKQRIALLLAFFLILGMLPSQVMADCAVPEEAVSAEIFPDEPPLVNLALGKLAVDSTGAQLVNAQKLTDGDKYYLTYRGSYGPGEPGKNEPYVEQGASAAPGAEWIQLDLGDAYPIEVINLKRRMYDTTHGPVYGDSTMQDSGKLNYHVTAIVIGNQPDLSDGYVVTCNGNPRLPQGLEKPEGATNSSWKSLLGGNWFYMDNTAANGMAPTVLGTTRTARYIRVYSDSPDSTHRLQLMELAVYGYRRQADIQTPHKRQIIDNRHPLMIAAAYSSDTYFLHQQENVGLQGYNTIAGRWNAVPEDLKPYTVLMMHNNNLGGQGTPHHVGQPLMQDYYEKCLDEALAAGAPTMLMAANASAVPGGSDWCITRSLDQNWVDLMYRMYPNMEGVFSTENFWSGYAGPVAANVAQLLETAHRHGGYVVYSEGDHNNYYDQVMGNPAFREAIAKYGDSYFMTYKNTSGSPDSLHSNSALMGSWLAGYIGGFGMLSDTWAWGNSGNGDLWQTGAENKNWKSVCGEPEAIFGIQMLQNYLSGGVIYTFEFPEVVYGAMDQNSPANTHVVQQVFRYICRHPAPSRAQVLDRTEVILYGDVNPETFRDTVGPDNAMNFMADGRYGGIPSIPNWGSLEEVTAHLKQTARREGVSAPVIVDHNDPLVNRLCKQYFRYLYPRTYLGSAFARQYRGSWFLFNSAINENIRQDATIALQAGNGTGRFTAELDPHTFLILDEQDANTVDIRFHNYRVSKTDLIFENSHGWDWSGSSATGQGVSPAKRTLYRYMAYYNVVDGKPGVPNLDTPDPQDTIDQLAPADNQLRSSVFRISSLQKAPTVEVLSAQKPDAQDGAAQYELPTVTYDPATKTAEITLTCNGWVNFRIGDLQFEEDDSAVKIEDPKPEEIPAELVNLALNRTVTASKEPTRGNQWMDRPLSLATDGVHDQNSMGYTDPGSDEGGPIWIQVDLGARQKVHQVNLWRYYADGRHYFNTVVMLSSVPDFAPDRTLVLWNANNAQSGRGGQLLEQVPEGTDGLYAESEQGRSFPVSGENVHWLDGNADRALPGQAYEARYVRIYMNGCAKDNWGTASNHIREIEVIGETEAAPENVAGNAAVTVSNPTSSDRPADWAVNGDRNDANQDYTDPGGNTGGPNWIQLDMGAQHEVQDVTLYRYWNDHREYCNTVVMLSSDPDFLPESTLILWNANGSAGGKNGQAVAQWPGSGCGQTGGTHTLPEGSDPLYQEQQEGHTFRVTAASAKWLSPERTDPLPAETGGRYPARYLRIYMNGSKTNASNHIVEIEVNGIRAEEDLTDTQAPEQVTGIRAENVSGSSAEISFDPSMDNMGMKGYELTITREGESQTVELRNTRVLLKELVPGAEYRVTVTAIDRAGNRSAISESYRFATICVPVSGTNMTLGNELSMNFMVRKSDVTDLNGLSMQITKTYADNRPDVVITVPAEHWKDYNKNYYAVKFSDISAKEMTDQITAVVLKEGEPAGQVRTESVAAYALRVLRGKQATAQLKAVIVDMLNYGAEAQKKFDYNTAVLANANLTDAEKALASEPIKVENVQVKGNRYFGSNLNLGNSMTMTVYFKGITPDMHATVSYTKHNGKEMTAEVSGADFVKFNDTVYGIRVSTLVVADAQQAVTVTVYDADNNVVASGTDSIASYVARSTTVGELGQAILKLATSAEVYFANR